MSTDDLVQFLHDRLNKDELTAGDALHPDAVKPGTWTTEHHNSPTHSEPNRCHIAEDKSGHYWSVADEVYIPIAEHIARWDPARVLRLITALRRALDEYSHEGRETAIIMAIGEALYGDHPDYREEWRP